MAAEQAAIRLLSVREHSRAELRQKLGRQHPPEVVEQVLQELVSRHLQSDERYAEQYVAMRCRKGYGPLRIRAELRDKGIDEQLIDTHLDDSDPAWRDLLREVVGRKYGTEPPKGQREMARQARFLEYRGFPAGIIRAYLFD